MACAPAGHAGGRWCAALPRWRRRSAVAVARAAAGPRAVGRGPAAAGVTAGRPARPAPAGRPARPAPPARAVAGGQAPVAGLDRTDARARRSAPERHDRRAAAVRGQPLRGDAEADAGRVAAAARARPEFPGAPLPPRRSGSRRRRSPSSSTARPGATTTRRSPRTRTGSGTTRPARVAAIDDGKLLMNLGDQAFIDYWKQSLVAQVAAGDDDGVFADSASPALLQWEAQSPAEPRLAGTGAHDTAIPELGGRTYIAAWQDFITQTRRRARRRGAGAAPEHRRVHHQLGHHRLRADRRRLHRRLRRSRLGGRRLAALDQPGAGARRPPQDHHRPELPRRRPATSRRASTISPTTCS